MLTVKIKTELDFFELYVDLRCGNEVVVVMGPLGSGKTTLLKAIAGLVRGFWFE